MAGGGAAGDSASGRSGAAGAGRGAKAGRGRGGGAKAAAAAALWTRRAAWMLLAVCAARLLLNLWTVVPVHFDEALYWAYGEEAALGYYSKPPLVPWIIRATTDLFGDTAFGLRAFAPAANLISGWFVFAAAARLYDARTGFWAAAVFTAAPGVNVASMLITTDPVMMAAWAAALYALVRAIDPGPPARGAPAWWRPGWWLLAGACVGLALLAKYTAIAAPLGAAGYALISREGATAPAQRRGAWLAAGAALAVLSPNLAWNAFTGFATVAHLGENASVGGGVSVSVGDMAEFVGAQFGVFGPVGLVAVAAGAWAAARGEGWRGRLLLWLTVPLLAFMCVQALLFGANANWAAPAYVAGAILAGRWLASRGHVLLLRAQAATGVATVVLLWGLGAVYGAYATDLPRLFDPFKKMRLAGPFCEMALVAYEGEGAEALLSDNRRRLSECMFQGGLTFDDVVYHETGGGHSNHFALRSPLRPGDDRIMLLAVESDVTAEQIAALFSAARKLDEGRIATHADRDYGYALWLVEGYEGE